MRTDRAYRQALPHEVALAELEGNAGTQFDPEIVKTLSEIVNAEHLASIADAASPAKGQSRAPLSSVAGSLSA